MAEVIWNKQAQQEWRSKMIYGLQEFGETSAINFVRQTNYIVENIRKHPKIGYIEPLLRHKRRTYRSCHLIGPLKMVYCYIESSDTIRIVDIWDMRRDPKHLTTRVR